MADIFTTVGTNMAADLFDGTISAPTNWFIGWGTGAGTAAVGDTTLFTEASEARVTATEAQPTAPVNRLTGTLTADGTKTITNAAVFSIATAGNMPIKGDFTGVPLVLNDQIAFTIDLTWS